MPVDLAIRHEVVCVIVREALTGIEHVLQHGAELDPYDRAKLSGSAAQLQAALLADATLAAPAGRPVLTLVETGR